MQLADQLAHTFTKEQRDYIAKLAESLEREDQPRMAVVDYAGWNDADGMVHASDPVQRRFGVRSAQHVAVYGFKAIWWNTQAREAGLGL